MHAEEASSCPLHFYQSMQSIDFERFYMYKHIVNGWLSIVFITLGMLSNSIAVLVFRQASMRITSTNLYLSCLSINNLMSLSCSMLTEALRWSLVHPYFDVYCAHSYEKFLSLTMPYLAPLNNFFQLTGIYLIVSASFDRLWLLTKRELLNETAMKKHRKYSHRVVIAVVICCLLFTIPNLFYFRSIEIGFDEVFTDTGVSNASSAYQV